ncbi:MAG: YqeG family HAD IIIA-type phosphatase [Tepidanaerobacteraceae bacterium]|jgi:HAD superfamily phosphatase (TIGR01668 family)|nr:YqeG family HAD IIIA-type phosphatase [Tepidanaerobacteraceae bacterium]
MLKLLLPDLYLDNIYNLDFEYLKKNNIKGLLIDLDNTLLPWDCSDISQDLMDWIKKCKDWGLSLCIVSNNRARRINECASRMGIPAVTRAIKPCKKAFLKGLNILGINNDQVAVIGDQIFTDVFGAKRMGMLAIMVKPASKKEFIWTKLMRIVENIVLKQLKIK